MAAVDIFTAPRMKQIEDTTVVGGLVDTNGNLLLTTRAGAEIDAGNVIGPLGPGFNYRGAWAATTAYAVRDVVTSEGSTFVVNVTHTSETTPPTSTAPGANLSLWARQGIDGLGFNYRGAWSPTTVYAVRDVVTSNGSTFIVNVAHTSSTTAPTATAPGANLSLWAQKGSDGIIGSDGSTAVPAGTISLWGSDTAPANWLICDGSAVSRTTYASLFSVVGTKYGAGDGVNTFNLPNLKGRTPVGLDTAQTEFNLLGKIGGSKTHLLTALESGLRSHNHTMPDHNHIEGWAGVNAGATFGAVTAVAAGNINSQSGQSALNHAVTSLSNPGVNTAPAADAQNAHNILQPYSVVNFIIKVTNGDTPGDSQLTQRVSALETFASASPAGTITIFGGDTAPTNWRLCDGAAVSRTTYASLFAAIGTKYGIGDGSTTFNLPNFKGRTPIGFDSTQTEFDLLGETGGAKTHKLSEAESGLRDHTHILPMSGTPGVGSTTDLPARSNGGVIDANFRTGRIADNPIQASGSGVYGSAGIAGTANTAAVNPHNNLQPYLVVNYIIKITNGDTKSDSQLTTRVGALESRTQYNTMLRDRTNLMQHLMTGGGTRKCNSSASVSWSQGFRTMGAGKDDLAPSGYFNIDMPPNGTVIPVIGHATVTSVTVAAGMINFSTLSGYGALYYDIPYGSPAASQSGRFKLVDYSVSPIVIPPSWLLICQHNIDANSPDYRWGDGRNQDRWRPLTLLTGWVNYSAPGVGFSNAAYRFENDGKILLRGLVAGGTGLIANMGASLGADMQSIFYTHANLGAARIDVNPNGDILLAGYTGGANNAFVALEGIAWYPIG